MITAINDTNITVNILLNRCTTKIDTTQHSNEESTYIFELHYDSPPYYKCVYQQISLRLIS